MGKKESKLEFSKDCLFEALLRLANEKPVDKISISELCSVAGISRTTFYRYYNTVLECLEDYLTVYPFGAMSPFVYSEKPDQPIVEWLEDRVRESMTFLKKNQNFINNIMESGLQIKLLENYETLIKGLCRNRANELGFNDEYALAAFTGIYFMLCYDWIIGGMKEDIDFMVRRSTELITQYLK